MYEQMVKRYRIYVDLANITFKCQPPVANRLIDLVKYSEYLNELVLEYSCINKLKTEEDYKYIGTVFHTNKNSLVKLKHDFYDESEVPDRFNIILELYK